MLKNKFIKNKKNKLFIFIFILFNIISILLVSIFQIYQRYIDLNASILNGVNRAVDNGIKLSDLRGSLRDIADSYLEGEVMSSSYLFSQINKVEIIKYNSENCDIKNSLLKRSLNNSVYAFLSTNNYNLYFCFENKFYSKTISDEKHIASWITGFPIKFSSISSYLKHIIFLSGIILVVSIFVLYKMLLRQEELRKKELTYDIASRIKHEIVRPVAKIQSVSEILFSNINKISLKDIKDKIYQINLLTKTHKLFVWSMFSYVLSKNNKKVNLTCDKVDLNEILDKCLNIAVQGRIQTHNVTRNISIFFEENDIIIDESYFAISILNIITNAYEAVKRNHKKFSQNEIDFKLELNADHDKKGNELIISIKNYGSYIYKNDFELIFNPGITNDKQTNSGYGLAILKDIVNFYDGIIQLESELNKTDMDQSWVKFTIIFRNLNFSKKDKNDIVDIYKNKAEILKNELKILVADDEVFFIDYFKDIFKNYPDCIKIYHSYTIDDAIKTAHENLIDLAIIDLKFGLDENGGLKIIDSLNIEYSHIVIHSSSFYKDYSSISSRISDFVQKAISKDKLFEIISGVYQKKYFINDNKDSLKSIKKIHAIVIDDESHLYDNWLPLNTDVNFYLFKCFDDLFDSLDSNEIELNKIDLILTDYYFDKIAIGMTLLTSNYLGTLRNIYDYHGFIVLSSNISIHIQDKIDATIDKTPIRISDLINRLKEKALAS